MTVAEYHSRFINLSRYGHSAVDNPISRCIKFKEGLRPNIRSQLAAFSFIEFHEVFFAAQRIENDILRNAEERKRGKNSSKKIDKKASMQGYGAQGSATSGSSGSSETGRFMPYSCYYCGPAGHCKWECPLRRQQTLLVEEGQ